MENKSQYIVTDNSNKIMSNIINAIEMSIDNATQQPTGLFGRKVSIKSGEVNISGDDLDIEFSVPFDDDSIANESEVIVYNLSKTTIDQLKYNQPFILTAGYGSDTGVILSGRISKVSSKSVGVDKKTTIYVLDDGNLTDKKLTNKAYGKNISSSYILKDLLKLLKLPIAVFKPRKDYVNKNAVTVSGNLLENIYKYADACGVSVYLKKGKIYAHDIRVASQDINFEISVDTGLIDSPEPFEEEKTADEKTEVIKGYKIKMLLQHRLESGVKVRVKSIDVNGVFTVRSGEQKCSGNDFVTEIEVIS